MSPLRLSLCLFLATALFVYPAMASENNSIKNKRSISVSAAGVIKAKPDLAEITTGVVSEATTARQALDANTKAMAQVVAALKEAGLEARDIQTTNFAVYPRFQRLKSKSGPRIIGYNVVNSVKIRVRDLTKLGDILDRVVTLGSNRIGGIRFDVSDTTDLKDDARKAAMANAIRKAKLYAAAAGAELGEVLTISEDVIRGGPRPIYARALKASAKSVPIEAGEHSVQVNVRVTWALE